MHHHNTTHALVQLFASAAFLPFAFWADWFNSVRPVDDAHSGAEEGARVIDLAQERKRKEANNA